MKRPAPPRIVFVLALTALPVSVLKSWIVSPAAAHAAPSSATLTAISLAFHQGDPVPPLIFEVSGFAAPDTFYSATTGRPALSTSATSASAPGTYPIHIAIGNTASTKYDLRVVDGSMTVLPPDGTGARNNNYAYPQDAMISVKTFGAVGDGVTDDTAALNRALSDGRSDCRQDYFRHPKMLYLPPGRYRITGQLTLCGAEVSLRGAGPAQSVIYVAPRTPAFNQEKPLPALFFPSAVTKFAYGNISFRNFVSALGIDIGEGNDNAIGLDAVMNNTGAIEDVIVTSEESAGMAGINLTHAWNGPMLVKNVAVYGFRNGFNLGQMQYSSVYSHITTEGQSFAGFQDGAGQSAAIEKMYSCNHVPAVVNIGAEVAVINSTFDCGSTKGVAYAGAAKSSQHLQNISVRGYGRSIEDKATVDGPTRSGDIRDYLTGEAKSAFAASAPVGSLNLPAEETPTVRDPRPASWISLSTTDPSRWSSQLAACSSSTAYLVAGQYTVAKQTYAVEIPSCIQHLQFFNSGFNPFGAIINLTAEGSAGDAPLLIENAGTGFSFTHKGARTLVLRHSTGEYATTPASGNLFLEDMQVESVHFQAGQHIWARQYDNEFAQPIAEHCKVAVVSSTACLPGAGVKTTCTGCTLWILGPKTERGSTNFQLTAGAHMELYGGFFLPFQSNQQPNTAVIESTDSSFTADFVQFLYGGGVNTGTAHIVSDSQHGVTHYVDPKDQNTTFRTSMVYSLGAGATRPSH